MAKSGLERFSERLRESGIGAAAFLEALDRWGGLSEEERESVRRTAPRHSPIDYRRIQTMYNATCADFSTVVQMSEARKRAIRARFADGFCYEDFQKLFERAQGSDFLKGENSRGWKATFDWLIKDSNMAKVLEGNYSGHRRPPGPTASYDLAELEKMLDQPL